MSGSMKALYQRCNGMKRNAASLMLKKRIYDMLRIEQIGRFNLNAVA